jgi:hypothetical protein
MWVLAAAGVASVAAWLVASLAGPMSPLVGWAGAAGAAGLVLRAAGDERAARATVAMVVLLPVAFVGYLLGANPLAAVAGPAAGTVAWLGLLALTPAAAVAMAGRRAPLAGDGGGGRWVGLRIGMAACTAGIVATGHAVVQFGRPGAAVDGGFVLFLLAGLLPAGIYVAGTRQPGTVLVSGYCVFAFTAAAWALFGIEDGNQFAGVWVFMGWALAAASATAGAMYDWVRR